MESELELDKQSLIEAQREAGLVVDANQAKKFVAKNLNNLDNLFENK